MMDHGIASDAAEVQTPRVTGFSSHYVSASAALDNRANIPHADLKDRKAFFASPEQHAAAYAGPQIVLSLPTEVRLEANESGAKVSPRPQPREKP